MQIEYTIHKYNKKQTKVLHVTQYEDNSYYQKYPTFFIELIKIVEKNPRYYPNVLRNTRKNIGQQLFDILPILQDPIYKVNTKVYWIIHDIQSFDDDRVKCKFDKKPFKNKNVRSLYDGYFKYCSVKCMRNDPEVLALAKRRCVEAYGVDNPMKCKDVQQKSKATHRKNFGCDYPGQCPSTQRKQKSSYFYDGRYFKNTWELSFYIWLKDRKKDFEYQPLITFKFYDQTGKLHTYQPDFKVDGKLYELKGDHFFKGNIMVNPYDKTHKSDHIYEAKHQCMLKNNVIIYVAADMKKYLDYVATKYGKDHLSKFKAAKSRSV